MRGHGAEAVLNQWKGSTFQSRKTSCWPLALWQRAAFTTLMSGSCLACILVGAWYNVRSAPTTLTSQPTTLQGHIYDPQTRMPGAHLRPTTLTAQPTTLQDHTYDPQTRMPGAHLRPSQLNLRPFKATPTTLKLACQERAYDPHSLRPFKATPTTLKPACQEVTTTLCALWPNTKVLAKAREKEKRLKASHTPPTVARQVLALYGVHIAKAHRT